MESSETLKQQQQQQQHQQHGDQSASDSDATGAGVVDTDTAASSHDMAPRLAGRRPPVFDKVTKRRSISNFLLS